MIFLCVVIVKPYQNPLNTKEINDSPMICVLEPTTIFQKANKINYYPIVFLVLKTTKPQFRKKGASMIFHCFWC